MSQSPISILSISSISSLGKSHDEIWKNFKNGRALFSTKDGAIIAEIPSDIKKEIEQLKNSKYKALDDSVLFAIYTARKAVKEANWKPEDNFGVNFSSSRGATELWEELHEEFLKTGSAQTLTSPTTTLGNISSWVAHDLQTNGPEISHSITCSSALHALLNGIAWIRSGMSNKFLVGGSEAPLTKFTVSQMKALKIYASENEEFPCRSLDIRKQKNTMILGEASVSSCIINGDHPSALAKIIGIGWGTEILKHSASLSTNAECFKRSMRMALKDVDPEMVDVIIAHSPGTIKGDQAEMNAINSIFRNKRPAITSNKWIVGHSLGPSGLLSIEMAVLMLNKQEFISPPYLNENNTMPIRTILVNAVGFGGNAVSILVTI